MADRLSWLALLAALSFSVAVVTLGRGASAGETETPSLARAIALTSPG